MGRDLPNRTQPRGVILDLPDPPALVSSPEQCGRAAGGLGGAALCGEGPPLAGGRASVFPHCPLVAAPCLGSGLWECGAGGLGRQQWRGRGELHMSPGTPVHPRSKC